MCVYASILKRHTWAKYSQLPHPTPLLRDKRPGKSVIPLITIIPGVSGVLMHACLLNVEGLQAYNCNQTCAVYTQPVHATELFVPARWCFGPRPVSPVEFPLPFFQNHEFQERINTITKPSCWLGTLQAIGFTLFMGLSLPSPTLPSLPFPFLSPPLPLPSP